MYLHIGNDMVVRRSDVLGVFDLDNTSQSVLTRRYLSAAEKGGRVVNAAGGELPKSFVVCVSAKGEQIVYLSQLNSSTLQKRGEEAGSGL